MSRVFEVGERIDDRFVLESPLGRGAFGAVWKARDLARDDKPVALKILFERHMKDERMLGRFVQEAQLLEKFDHPNIAQLMTWNGQGRNVYLALEFVDGQTLDLALMPFASRDRLFPADGALWVVERIARAISYAHALGVVHRDLKPKNIMIHHGGQAPTLKVLDFGVAKMLAGSMMDPTTVGRVLGSVLYVAPEQVLGRPIEAQADVFSLASIAFEMITLRRAWARDDRQQPLPFHMSAGRSENNSHVAVLKRIARGGRPKISSFRPDLPVALDEVFEQALAIDAKDRPQTAQSFLWDFQQALGAEPRAPLTNPPKKSRRPSQYAVPTSGGSLSGPGIPTLQEPSSTRVWFLIALLFIAAIGIGLLIRGF